MVQAQEVSLKKVKVNKEIIVFIPEDFIQMTEQDIAEKYISYRAPLALFTNQNRTIDFGVNLSVTHWKPSDIEILQDFYESSIRSLYTEVDFIRKEIETVNEVPFAVFEFISTVEGEQSAIKTTTAISKYTLIYYAIVNNKTVLFNFTAPATAKNEWQGPAKEIMQSIQIKKTL